MSALKRILKAQTAVSKVPKVMLKSGRLAALIVVLGCVARPVGGQAPDPAKVPGAKVSGPAESLYLKLRSVALDPSRVYKVREASLERAALHISLDDGTIAFTQDTGGHITGAFFHGEGEALLLPPNTTERASLAVFTGAAILEEKFSNAYFRFNDDVLNELQPALRTADAAGPFAAEWDTTASNLAPGDAFACCFPSAAICLRRKNLPPTTTFFTPTCKG